MAKMIHSMIRVVDEARAVSFYKAAFDLNVVERFPFDGFTLIYLANSEQDFELELTVNKGKEAYNLGDGYGHLAVSVDNLDAAHAKISATGAACTPVKELSLPGRGAAKFFFVTDPDGYKIEVLQRGGRFK